MKQLDMFEDLKPKIYESPDGGKTIYERALGANPSTRILIESPVVKTSVQQQWNITFNGKKVDL